MLTNETVLEIFADYLEKDQDVEVVDTRRGMTYMLWDDTAADWSETACCSTPEKLFDKLLDSFIAYQECLAMEDNGWNELTEETQAGIRALCQPYLDKRKEAESPKKGN